MSSNTIVDQSFLERGNRLMHGFRAAFAMALLSAGISAHAQTNSAIRQIALGYQHACAITQSSALYCWGGNKFGQVGDGKAGADVVAPTLIIGGGVSAVSAGSDNTCAIVSGALWCWGENDLDVGYEVGAALGKYVDKPTLVIPKNVTFVDVPNDGLGNICAIVAGAVRCWGWGYGNKPVEMIHAGATAVALGWTDGDCAIVRGALDCWRTNDLADFRVSPPVKLHFTQTTPREMIHAGVTAIALGTHHGCAIVRGALWCWGDNEDGVIGNGEQGNDIDQPVRVIDAGVTAVTVAGENQYTCATVHDSLQCWGNNNHGWIDVAHPRANVLRPKTLIPSGVSAIAESESGALCALAHAKLRCRTPRGADNSQQHLTLGWPHLNLGVLLSFGVGIGDIDSIGPDVPAKRAAQEMRALNDLAPRVAKALQGALISDGLNVFKVLHADVDVDVDNGKLLPKIDAIPLYRVLHDSNAVRPVGGAPGFHAVLPKDATCGDANSVDGHYAGDRWVSGAYAGLYIQTGNDFILAGDALQYLTPLSPQLFVDWSASVALSPKIAPGKGRMFRKFNACADAIQREWLRQPFQAIRVGAHYDAADKPPSSGNASDDEGDEVGNAPPQNWEVDVGPRATAVWYDNTDDGGANYVVVKPKDGIARSDFSIEARAISRMYCGEYWLSGWKQGEALPWKLSRNGTQFTLPGWVSNQMYTESPAFPPYTPEELQHAIAAIPELARMQDLARDCAPALWGDQFTVYYRSKPVERIYVESPRTPPTDSSQALDSALHLANRAGVTVLPKYAVSKPWPGDPSLTIVALALPEKNSGDTDNQDAQKFALEMLVMNTDSGEVLQRYRENNAFTSGAFEFEGIELDTADYAVNPAARAIGLRATYDHTGYDSADEASLQLFVPEGSSLKSLLAPLVVATHGGEGQSDCQGDTSQSVSTVAIGTTFTHGYADLVVRQKTTEDKTENCKETHSTSANTWTLRFDGHQYQVPPDLAL